MAITNHERVGKGLWQVHMGEGFEEYRNPVEFFRRTFLTQGLRDCFPGRTAGTGTDS